MRRLLIALAISLVPSFALAAHGGGGHGGGLGRPHGWWPHERSGHMGGGPAPAWVAPPLAAVLLSAQPVLAVERRSLEWRIPEPRRVPPRQVRAPPWPGLLRRWRSMVGWRVRQLLAVGRDTVGTAPGVGLR